VDLLADEAPRELLKRALVGQILDRPTIDPGLNSCPLGYDPVVVPLPVLEMLVNKDVRKADLKNEDIVVEIDGRTDIPTHSELLAFLVQQKASGDKLSLTVLRGGERKQIDVPLQWNDRIDALRTA
jgi:S1-C subfamily serine protease